MQNPEEAIVEITVEQVKELCLFGDQGKAHGHPPQQVGRSVSNLSNMIAYFTGYFQMHLNPFD